MWSELHWMCCWALPPLLPAGYRRAGFRVHDQIRAQGLGCMARSGLQGSGFRLHGELRVQRGWGALCTGQLRVQGAWPSQKNSDDYPRGQLQAEGLSYCHPAGIRHYVHIGKCTTTTAIDPQHDSRPHCTNSRYHDQPPHVVMQHAHTVRFLGLRELNSLEP